MIVAARREWTPFESHGARFAAGDFPNACDAARGLDADWKREQQFVVFAAVKSAVKGRSARDGYAVHFGRDVRRQAKTVEIERQAIAQIDAGGGTTDQAFAQREPGFDAAVPGFTQSAGYVKCLAGACSVAPERPAARRRASHHHIAVNFVIVSEIAAGENAACPPCQA